MPGPAPGIAGPTPGIPSPAPGMPPSACTGNGIFPWASDVITPGHSIWIAIPATIPAMFGGSPVFPESCEVIDAMVAPGFTSDGQMDWPIPAILSVNEPLVPVPVPFSAALIGSLVGSACARAGNAAPAAMMPAATASGRSAVEAALMQTCSPWAVHRECRHALLLGARRSAPLCTHLTSVKIVDPLHHDPLWTPSPSQSDAAPSPSNRCCREDVRDRYEGASNRSIGPISRARSEAVQLWDAPRPRHNRYYRAAALDGAVAVLGLAADRDESVDQGFSVPPTYLDSADTKRTDRRPLQRQWRPGWQYRQVRPGFALIAST